MVKVDKKQAQDVKRVVIFGGNGFVGSNIAKHVYFAGNCTVCLSRTGHKPLHLKDEKWGAKVRWCKGDASNPDEKFLPTVDVLVCAVGSPPTPTFSQEAFDKQLDANGTVCVEAIQAAQNAGIKKIVLIGAQIPKFLDSDRFAYTKGKRMALAAAKEFSEQSEDHTAIVLQPGAIYGKRHLENGKVVHLDWFMLPMRALFPWQFVSVDHVAKRVADAVSNEEPYAGKFTILRNSDI